MFLIINLISLKKLFISSDHAGFNLKEEIKKKCLEIYQLLKDNNIDVLWDDRDKRPGVKFADMEVTGIPFIIIIGERTIETGEIELKERKDEKPKLASHQDLVSIIKS